MVGNQRKVSRGNFFQIAADLLWLGVWQGMKAQNNRYGRSENLNVYERYAKIKARSLWIVMSMSSIVDTSRRG